MSQTPPRLSTNSGTMAQLFSPTYSSWRSTQSASHALIQRPPLTLNSFTELYSPPFSVMCGMPRHSTHHRACLHSLRTTRSFTHWPRHVFSTKSSKEQPVRHSTPPHPPMNEKEVAV